MAGEITIHQQVGHYTGVLRELVSAHHVLRGSGKCEEHGAVDPAHPATVETVDNAIRDVARLISKLSVTVETGATPRTN